MPDYGELLRNGPVAPEINDIGPSNDEIVCRAARRADRLADRLVPRRHHVDETVDHPAHYGDADDPYETIKVIEAWGLGFHLGNAVKYISRAGRKGDRLEDLKKARWYLDREIERAVK